MRFQGTFAGSTLGCLLFLSPALALADDTPISVILAPVAGTYTHSQEIFPSVVFASTSRIVDVEYLLAGKPVSYADALPFFDLPLGTTTFSVVVRDMDGVAATTSVQFALTATPQSLRTDIEEAHKRGFISKQVTRDRMMRSLELFADTYARKQELLEGPERKKAERVALLNDRLEKILDTDLLDLIKKQEGRTIKKGFAANMRAQIEALRVYTR